MDRDRRDSRRFDDVRRGGESYRPSDRPPLRSPRPDIRPARSPIRSRSPLRPADTWVPLARPRPRSRSPPGFRRRSRSPPPFRGGGRTPGYGARPRSPFRRSPPPPRRDSGRSPQPLTRRSRSPPPNAFPSRPPLSRAESFGVKRPREPSPSASYRPYSPKRERRISPVRNQYDRPRSPGFRGTFRSDDPRPLEYARPRSPDRREPWREPYSARSWRRRSPSPPPRPGPGSGPNSSSTSRRSSPPSRQERTGRAYSGSSPHPSTQGPLRPQYDSPALPRPNQYPRRPEPRPAEETRTVPIRPISPPKGPRGGTAPPPRPVEATPVTTKAEPERDQVKDESKEPPKGPSFRANQNPDPAPKPTPPENRSSPTTVPPGPTPQKPAEYATRVGNAALLSAPTRPKGAPGPPSAHFNRDTGPPREPPRPTSGRRGGGYGPPFHGSPPGGRPPSGPGPGGYDSHRPPPFRHGSNTSTTYPRTQRFTNHLAGLPTIIPGGKLLPSIVDPAHTKRLSQLEADRERLLGQISEKQRGKRAHLKDWNRLSRESATGSLRSELAEGHLQRLAEGDNIGGGAAF